MGNQKDVDHARHLGTMQGCAVYLMLRFGHSEDEIIAYVRAALTQAKKQ